MLEIVGFMLTVQFTEENWPTLIVAELPSKVFLTRTLTVSFLVVVRPENVQDNEGAWVTVAVV